MQAVEKRVAIVLADISGYTRFMVDSHMSAICGQKYITYLIESLIREIDVPLRLQEIEGDALFLYAEDPGGDTAWQEALDRIPGMLQGFFDAFYKGIAVGMEASACSCAICRRKDELALKIVVHTGTAVFHEVGGFSKLSGPDVILAHRLLKNSVPDKEYVLMTGAAYDAIGRNMPGQFLTGKESYDDFGQVKTHVRFNGDIKAQHRNSLYQLPRPSLIMRAQRYTLGETGRLFPALVKQLRSPAINAGFLQRLGYASALVILAPLITIMHMVKVPRRLLGQRGRHNYLAAGNPESI
jgi:class 3 adenylate cyclase